MQIDSSKLDRQLIGVNKWFDNNCIGILDYATGVGKTYAAILAIKRLLSIEPKTIVIVVPSDALRTQWNKELSKHFSKKDLNVISIFTAAQIVEREIVIVCDILIIDEIHEFTSDERLQIINNQLVKRTGILGLTASTDDKNFYLIKKYVSIVDRISEQEAKEKGWIAAFIEYNLALELTEEELEEYKELSEKVEKLMPRFDNDISLAQKCLSGGYHKKRDPNTGKRKYYVGEHWAIALAHKRGYRSNLDVSIDSHRLIHNTWHPNKIIGYANSLLTAVRKRKELLCMAESKQVTTLLLLEKFNKVKTIVFSESIDFADLVYDLAIKKNHKAVIYHSRLKTVMKPSPKTNKLIKYGAVRLRKEALEHLNKGIARIIFTAKSLDRGFDAKDLRMGLTASGSQSHTQYKQRGGRVKRKEDDIFGDYTVLLVNLFIKDTKDEVWLKKRQDKAKHEIITVNSIEEIGYTPPPNQEFLLTDL
jgi:superfamily II DNA or RNA helicase